MIPFARIVKYGNVLPKGPSIIDVKHSYTSNITTYILRDNGELWGGGYNGNGALGLGNTSDTYRNKCVKLRSDVKLMNCFSSNVVIITNDNKILFAGNDDRITSGSSSFVRSTWFDMSNRFSSVTPISEIKKIGSTPYNLFVLTSTGNMYGVGLGRALGANIAATSGNYTNTPSLISTNVADMQVGAESTTFRKTDGTIWGFGNNGYGAVYAMDVSSPTSTSNAAYVLAPVQMFITHSPSTALGWYGGQNNNMMVSADGTTTTGCGAAWYGTLGTGYNTNGTVGNLSTVPSMTVTLPMPCAETVRDTPNSMQRAYKGTDGFFYMIGYNPAGELGLGYTQGTGNAYAITDWTKNTNLPAPNDEVVGFSFGYFVSFMYTETDVYVCGNTTYSVGPNIGTAVPTFTKVPIDFG